MTVLECLGGLIVGFLVVKCLAELDFWSDVTVFFTPLSLVLRDEKFATFSIKDLLIYTGFLHGTILDKSISQDLCLGNELRLQKIKLAGYESAKSTVLTRLSSIRKNMSSILLYAM